MDIQEKIDEIVDRFGGDSEAVMNEALRVGGNDISPGSPQDMKNRGVLSWYTAHRCKLKE
ncbi:MAG: hypothetical protein GY749_46575 [Desulfobacteraceae bacterium]|nr:hypothetical protein [Desulfobacteraceae bacterium]